VKSRNKTWLIIAVILAGIVLAAWFGLGLLSRQNVILLVTPTDKRLLVHSSVPIGENDHRVGAVVQKIAANSATKSVLWKGDRRDDAVAYSADIDGDGVKDTIMGIGALCLVIDVSRHQRRYGQSVGLSGIMSVGFDDVDGDGALDAWFYDAGDQYLDVLWGDGEGNLVGQERFTSLYASACSFYDFDGDGTPDIVCENSLEEYTRLFPHKMYSWIRLEKKPKDE
jgi:hypothetical protein